MKIVITLLVIIHLLASVWHGEAHTALAITLSGLKNLFVYLVIVAGPVVGAVLVWTRFFRPGVAVVAISMAGALAFGVYHHYILLSPDNIAHLPAGPVAAQSQFIASAAVIAIFELVAALTGFYVLGSSRKAQ